MQWLEKSDSRLDRAPSPRQGDQDAHLSFFGGSFDTISDAGRSEFAMDPPLSPSSTSRGGVAVLGRSHHSYHASAVDIALPDLHQDMADTRSTDDHDISPIKVRFNREHKARSHGSEGDGYTNYHNSNYAGHYHRPNHDDFGHFHGVDSGPPWTSGYPVSVPELSPSYAYPNYHTTSRDPSHAMTAAASNPFFVIRSARKAFENCTFRLPCLRRDEMCAVNVSDYGHIHHYKAYQQVSHWCRVLLHLSIDVSI